MYNLKFNKIMNYTKSEMKIIHKVFQHYLDSHDSDEETRDFYLKIELRLESDMIKHLREVEKNEIIDKNSHYYKKSDEELLNDAQAGKDLSWEFDNSSPIIHLDEDGNEDKDSPLSNPLDNHFKMMAHMVTNLTKKHK